MLSAVAEMISARGGDLVMHSCYLYKLCLSSQPITMSEPYLIGNTSCVCILVRQYVCSSRQLSHSACMQLFDSAQSSPTTDFPTTSHLIPKYHGTVYGDGQIRICTYDIELIDIPRAFLYPCVRVMIYTE